MSDIYAQIAVLSRVTAIFEEHGVEPSGQEHYIAETFCTRAAQRVKAQLDQIEYNDDERMIAIAKLALQARRIRLRVLRGLTWTPQIGACLRHRSLAWRARLRSLLPWQPPPESAQLSPRRGLDG